MSCDRIQVLIDTLPFSDDPQTDQQSIEQHTRNCQTCAKTYTHMQKLESALRSLEAPLPPETLAPLTIARLNQEKDSNTATIPQKRSRDYRFAWVWLFAAVLTGLTHQVLFFFKDSEIGLQSLSHRLQNNLQAFAQGSPGNLLLACAMFLAAMSFLVMNHGRSQT